MRKAWLLALGIVGCGGAGEPPPDEAAVVIDIDELAGCYRLDIAEWYPRVDSANAQFHQVPPAVELRLDIAQATGTAELLVALPTISTGYVFPSREELQQPGRWLLDSPDSLTVVWTDGHTGSMLTARIESVDTIVGTATAISDNAIGPPYPGSPFRLIRTSCE